MSAELAAPPRPWSTGDAGSFAQRTLEVRVPQILEDTVAQNAARFPSAVLERCAALLLELRQGPLRPLTEDAPDRAAWDAACAPHVGRSWLDVPWYFAESFFYRRLLEATQFFGTRSGMDPFFDVKQREEQAMLPRVRAIRDALGTSFEPLCALLHASLWGNRADLSYAVGRAFGEEGAATDLLVDHTAEVLAALGQASQVALLLDNAGTELACDLLLADALARRGIHVVLFAKAHPFFVSDATPVDVERTRALLGLDRLPVVAHPFMTSSGFLRIEIMPGDLITSLSQHDLVLVKGDANYRRLVADAPWPFATPAEQAMAFPAPLVALRTCKAEVLVGVPDAITERARSTGADWITNGRFGLVQHVH